jgi:DNA ligase (NAD+)
MANTNTEELRKMITLADIAYYTHGKQDISDEAYDRLKDELRKTCPEDPLLKTIGARIGEENIHQKCEHSIPMGSLNKFTQKEDFIKWCEKRAQALGITVLELVMTLKFDGSSISLEFLKGKIKQAITRGDGEIGEDITANACRFLGIPETVILKGEPFSGFIRCEAIMETHIWEAIDTKKKSNPRNAASGISQRKDGSDSQHIKVMAFRAYDEDKREIEETEDQMLKSLKNAGFDTGEWVKGSPQKIWDAFKQIEEKRKEIPYWIDGVVLKINDIPVQNSLGASDNRPKGQIALKFKAETAQATIKSIRNTVGHSGAITPTALFEPTQVAGTMVQKATLSNWTIANALNIRIGDVIEFHKAGEIIPEVLGIIEHNTLEKPISQPTECPECRGYVEYKRLPSGKPGAILFCMNPECSAQKSKKITNFINKVGILGIGDVTLEAMISKEILQNFGDIFRLKERTEELESLTTEDGRALGKKRAQKILKNIESKKEMPLHIFLGALGIDGLGRREVEKITTAEPKSFGNLEDWLEGEILIHAIRLNIPNKARKFHNGIQKNKEQIQSLLDAGVIIKKAEAKPEVSSNAKSFCITGALSQPKKHYKEQIEAAGHIWKDSVNKDLDYLVMADKNSTSSKAQKARKAGVNCIDENDLDEILTNNEVTNPEETPKEESQQTLF